MDIKHPQTDCAFKHPTAAGQMSNPYGISREQLAVGPRRIRSIRFYLLKRLSENIRYTTVCLIQQMKWLAQLKIQARGRAVALKEAAAVQQCARNQKKKKYIYIVSTSGYLRMLYRGSTLVLSNCGEVFYCAHTSRSDGCCQQSSNQWNLTGIYELCNACPIRWSACKRNPRRAHTVSHSCLLWVSFDIISARRTAPAICHCAWPLGRCRGETGGGRPIMGQQHLTCDESGQKGLKSSAREQLAYL